MYTKRDPIRIRTCKLVVNGSTWVFAARPRSPVVLPGVWRHQSSDGWNEQFLLKQEFGKLPEWLAIIKYEYGILPEWLDFYKRCL